MIPIFNISRKLWKQKPQQWGNVSDVQSGLFHNAESMGINPESIALAMPMWNSGDQRDYSKNALVGTNTNATYLDNQMYFNGSSSEITNLGKYRGNTGFTIITQIQIFSISGNPGFIDTKRAAYWGTTTGFAFNLRSSYGCIFKVGSAETYTLTTPIAASRENFQFSANFIPSVAQDIYKNGNKISYELNNISDDSVAISPYDILVGSYYDLAADKHFHGLIKSILLISGPNTNAPEVISTLSDNPYALWQPRTPTFYSFPSVSSGYRIRYGTATDSYETAEVTDTEYIQTGLDPGTLYMAQVQAYEGDDDSAWTDWVEVTTLSSTLSPNKCSVVVTGFDATILTGTTISASTGSVSVSGMNPDVSIGNTISTTTGTVTATGINANVSTGQSISASLGTVAVTGFNPDVSIGKAITCTAPSITVTGFSANVSAGSTISATAGNTAAVGINADISAGSTIATSTGAVTVAGYAADITHTILIEVTTGTIIITGLATDISSGEIPDVPAQRIYSIESENRIYNIESENRVYPI